MSELSQIKSSLQKVRNPVIRERLLMVQAALELPLREAAEEFGCTHAKVDFWKQRYEEYGLRGLSTKTRSGRPPKITKEQTIKIRRVVRKHNIEHGWRTREVKELIAKEIKPCLCSSSIFSSMRRVKSIAL